MKNDTILLEELNDETLKFFELWKNGNYHSDLVSYELYCTDREYKEKLDKLAQKLIEIIVKNSKCCTQLFLARRVVEGMVNKCIEANGDPNEKANSNSQNDDLLELEKKYKKIRDEDIDDR